MTKLYLVVTATLTPGQQFCQAMHAYRQFIAEHTAVEADWFAKSNTLVFLVAKNEATLAKAVERCERNDIPVAQFREPDLGDQLTAIAAVPPNPAKFPFPLVLADETENGDLANFTDLFDAVRPLLVEECRDCNGTGKYWPTCGRCGMTGCLAEQTCGDCGGRGTKAREGASRVATLISGLEAAFGRSGANIAWLAPLAQ